MSHKLAFFTVSVFHEPVGSPRVQGFIDRAAAVYAAADASSGFCARSIRDYATWKHSWGDMVLPKCYPKVNDNHVAMTLSLWDDLESVAAFSHKGLHAEALSHRTEWFQSLGLPTYVAWWVAADHQPEWQEAADRLDELHATGSTARAFNFKTPFDPQGNQVRLDALAMQFKAKANAAARS